MDNPRKPPENLGFVPLLNSGIAGGKPFRGEYFYGKYVPYSAANVIREVPTFAATDSGML
jgi:hypothetical protein